MLVLVDFMCSVSYVTNLSLWLRDFNKLTYILTYLPHTVLVYVKPSYTITRVDFDHSSNVQNVFEPYRVRYVHYPPARRRSMAVRPCHSTTAAAELHADQVTKFTNIGGSGRVEFD